jgi:hypothetical protein
VSGGIVGRLAGLGSHRIGAVIRGGPLIYLGAGSANQREDETTLIGGQGIEAHDPGIVIVAPTHTGSEAPNRDPFRVLINTNGSSHGPLLGQPEPSVLSPGKWHLRGTMPSIYVLSGEILLRQCIYMLPRPAGGAIDIDLREEHLRTSIQSSLPGLVTMDTGAITQPIRQQTSMAPRARTELDPETETRSIRHAEILTAGFGAHRTLLVPFGSPTGHVGRRPSAATKTSCDLA